MAQEERPPRQINRGYDDRNQQGRSYQRPAQNNYREQSGGGYSPPSGFQPQGGRTDFRQQRPSPQQREENEQQAIREFQRGDRMPTFESDDRDGKMPWE